MRRDRLPKGKQEWEEYWKEWNKLPKPHHEVTDEMAEEYYKYMEGKRRYLSFSDTVTMGQLETLRQLYENKLYIDQMITVPLEELEEPPSKRCQTEEKWKSQQTIPNIEPVWFKKQKPLKSPSGSRQTKWTRVKRHGVLQLRLRELEKPPY